MFFSLISQSVPVNPGGQVQEYVAMPSVHVPPLLQGFPKQSLISNKKVKFIYRLKEDAIEFN